MKMLFLAVEANNRQWVLTTTYASNEIEAQANFSSLLSPTQKAQGFYVKNTDCQENTPEAKLLEAIFGNE